jgi:hypothetical protein
LNPPKEEDDLQIESENEVQMVKRRIKKRSPKRKSPAPVETKKKMSKSRQWLLQLRIQQNSNRALLEHKPERSISSKHGSIILAIAKAPPENNSDIEDSARQTDAYPVTNELPETPELILNINTS